MTTAAAVQTQPPAVRSVSIEGVTLEALRYVTKNLRPPDRLELEATRFDEVSLVEQVFGNQGTAYTVNDRDGNPAAVGGVGLVSPGVAQAWMFGTDRLPEAAVAMHRTARALLDSAFRTGRVHRIQAYSAVFHTAAHAWLKRLGFEVESTLRQWGKHREDFFLFVRLAEGANHG